MFFLLSYKVVFGRGPRETPYDGTNIVLSTNPFVKSHPFRKSDFLQIIIDLVVWLSRDSLSLFVYAQFKT